MKLPALAPIAAAAVLLASCERRPLENLNDLGLSGVASIPVHIDWSRSGITVPAPAGDEVNRIHRVSIRFFPKDGSPAFDRYLEEPDITNGVIEVPIGKYSVIVFNETVDDVAWWDGAITFTDINSYEKFAAHAVPYDQAQLAASYPFFQPAAGEKVVKGPSPRKLASWSIDNFEVTQGMAMPDCSTAATQASDANMMKALTDIEMRGLTYNVTVTASVKNLTSSQINYCYVSGLADMVYMGSAITAQSTATTPFLLNGRTLINDTDGTTTHSFLSFGRTPETGVENYAVSMDVLYKNGELYTPNPAMGLPSLKNIDVTNQVELSRRGIDYNINIAITVMLEFIDGVIEGGITVDDWKDKEFIIN